MSTNEEFVNFCKSHVNDLEKRLSEIYTIDRPDDYGNEHTPKKINIIEDLEKLKHMESIYAVIEEEGVTKGDIFRKYNGYLEHIRESLPILEAEKEKIENQYSFDIKNIELLLDTFKRQIKAYE